MDPGSPGSNKPPSARAGYSLAEADFDDGDDQTAAAKAAIRAKMRRRRAGLGADALAAAGAAAVVRLRALPVMRTARLVAAYRAVRGEIPLEDLIDGGSGLVAGDEPGVRSEIPPEDLMNGPPLGSASVRYTLPRVRGQDLEFALRRLGDRFEPGAFGIPEPVGGEVVALADHDVVLVPLVAFDAEGRRVGNGKGFYDRALAGLAAGPPDPDPGAGARGRSEAAGRLGPVLIGVAHSFQQVDEAPSHPWDVALDAVVTEAGLVEVALQL